MNENLALDTISNLLEWEKEGLDKNEFEWLKLLSQFKYDNYEGYEPGSRFFTNLIGWLKQFSDIHDRKTAYDFLKNHLIFFSRQEIIHLVYRLWPLAQREVINVVADQVGIPQWEVMSKAKEKYDIHLRQSLFVGLSDGAKMDVFRRDNEGTISNEQTLVAYEISKKKWTNICDELQKEIAKKDWNIEPVFKHVFLIDDFTASGTTLIRYDKVKKEWKGKIKSFMEHIGEAGLKVLDDNCHIHVHHYVGTATSEKRVKKRINDFKCYLASIVDEADGKQKYPNLSFTTSFGLVLDKKFYISKKSCPDFLKLITQHYDKSVQTDTTGCVKFGYKRGRLSVVFEHNSPNNSVGLIWAETAEKHITQTSTPMTPLFRRRTRHL